MKDIIWIIGVYLMLFTNGVNAQSCGPLNTTMSSNNSQDGNMFSITALNPIRIDSFWCHFYAGTIDEVEIWYREGDFIGFQNSPVGWTKVDSVTNLTSAGPNNYTKVPIFVDLDIQAGCEYSFYVTRAAVTSSALSMRYTNGPFGSTAGALYTQNTDMQVSYAYGKDYPFGATFNPRIWNGRIHYTCIPASIPNVTMTSVPSTSCSGDTVIYSFIPGSTMAPGAWSWSPGASGTIVAANNDSSQIEILFNGTVVFDTICLELQGGCENVDTCFPIAINPPTADAGPDASICTTSYQLDGNIAQGFWEVVGGSGTFADPTMFNTTVSGLAPGVNTFKWSVGNANCDTVFDEVNITVNPIPVAQFTAPNGCVGEVIPFSDNSYVLGGVIQLWNWDVNGDGSIDYTTNSFNHVYTAPGTYQCTLMLTASQGCIDTLVKPIVISPNPTVDFTYDPDCEGSPMTFTDLTTISSGGLAAWNWDFGDGSNPSLAQNPAHVYLIDGFYEVTLTVTSNLGCTSAFSDTVEVYSIPLVDFISPEVCSNDTVMLTDTSISTQGSINYWEWDFGDGSPVNYNQNTMHRYPTHGLYNIRLTVATDRGCTNTVVKQQRSFPVPLPDYVQDGVCEQQRVLFTDNSQLDTMFNSSLASFHWDFGDGSDAINKTVGHFYQEPGYYTLAHTPYSNHGCHHTREYEILMRPKPEAKILVLNDKVCAGNEVDYRDETYFDYTYDSVGVVSWKWFFGDSNTSLNQHPSNTFVKGGEYNTLLIVETGYGCIDSAYRPTLVYHNPVAAFSIDSFEGCSPHCATFMDKSILATGEDLIYHWDFGDGWVNEIDVNPTYCYSTVDGSGITKFDVTLRVLTPNGCADTFSHPQKIILHANPFVDFELSAGNISILDPVVYIDNFTVGADEWLWNFGDSNVSTRPYPMQHEYKEPGTYTVGLTATSDFGCSSHREKRINVERHQTLYIPMSFTPNADGVNDYFQVYGEDLELVRLWIYNRWGDELFFGEGLDVKWDGKVNGLPLPIGSYAYVLEYKQYEQTRQKATGSFTISRTDN